MIEPIKLLHAADLHLDSPFAGLPPEQAAARRLQARQLLELLPRLCRRAGCRLVLLAGDLFDTGAVYRDTVDQLRQALAECPAQVFIAPGNHDPMGPDSPYRRYSWPSQVHIFTSSQIETLDLGDCTVSGAAFCDGQLPSLAGFHAPQDGRPHFMSCMATPMAPLIGRPPRRISPPPACATWPWAISTAAPPTERSPASPTLGPVAFWAAALMKPVQRAYT